MLPEIYTEAVTPDNVEEYTQLLSVLPEEAQWWVTRTGWGLEDLVLDANEEALPGSLAFSFADKDRKISMNLRLFAS